MDSLDGCITTISLGIKSKMIQLAILLDRLSK